MNLWTIAEEISADGRSVIEVLKRLANQISIGQHVGKRFTVLGVGTFYSYLQPAKAVLWQNRAGVVPERRVMRFRPVYRRSTTQHVFVEDGSEWMTFGITQPGSTFNFDISFSPTAIVAEWVGGGQFDEMTINSTTATYAKEKQNLVLRVALDVDVVVGGGTPFSAVLTYSLLFIGNNTITCHADFTAGQQNFAPGATWKDTPASVGNGAMDANTGRPLGVRHLLGQRWWRILVDS